MEWELVIERNREALRRILAMLLAMAGFDAGERGSPTLLRLAHRAILRLLRPAESARRSLAKAADIASGTASAQGAALTFSPCGRRTGALGLGGGQVREKATDEGCWTE